MRGRGGNVAAVAAVAAVSVLAPALGLGVESCTDDHSQWCVNDDHVSTKTMQTIDGLGEAADAEKSQRNSIIDFVDPKLLDESNLDMIRSSLRSGKLVVINDAFTIEFAEHVYSIISREDQLNYTREQYYVANNHMASTNLNKTDGGEEDLARDIIKANLATGAGSGLNRVGRNYPGHNLIEGKIPNHVPEIDDLYDMFLSKRTKEFLTSISTRSCMGESAQIHFVRQTVGDYSNQHNGFSDDRSTSFLWNLSKEWEPQWGGCFFWGPSKTMDYLCPRFNTLVLFVPTMSSTHLVTPITKAAAVNRYVLTAKYAAPRTIDKPLDDKEDYIKLSAMMAEELVNGMWPDFAEDRELQQSLRENYLFPTDGSVLISEYGEDDDSEDDEGVASDDMDELRLQITEDTSLLDVLDPKILEDEDLLDEIRWNMWNGNLVKLQDAFKPEFANLIKAALDRDDLDWDKIGTRASTRAGVTGYVSQKNLLQRPPSDLGDALEVFKHPKSKRFMETISGRDCSDTEAFAPIWVKPGEYSSPHSDYVRRRSVAVVWHLTEQPWDPSFGGAFTWLRDKSSRDSYHHADFNTLYLFNPNPSTIHHVTPVTFWSEGKRLGVLGWYLTDSKQLTDDEIDDLIADDDNLKRLSHAQAKWLVNDMETDGISDPDRVQKLAELRSTAINELLEPVNDSIFRL